MNKQRIIRMALIVLSGSSITAHAHSDNDPFGFNDFFNSMSEFMSNAPTRSPHQRVIVASVLPQEETEAEELSSRAFAEAGKVIIEVDAAGVDKEDVTVAVNRSKRFYNVHITRTTKDKRNSQGRSNDGNMQYRSTAWISSTRTQEQSFAFPKDLDLKGKKIEVRLKEEAKNKFDDVEVIKIK